MMGVSPVRVATSEVPNGLVWVDRGEMRGVRYSSAVDEAGHPWRRREYLEPRPNGFPDVELVMFV